MTQQHNGVLENTFRLSSVLDHCLIFERTAMTDNYDLWKELHDIARATDNDEGRCVIEFSFLSIIS